MVALLTLLSVVSAAPGCGSTEAEDCAPCDASVYPTAVDGCNAKDDDCDDEVDENCVYSLKGYGFGNGFVLDGQTTGLKLTHSVGTTSFAGKTSNEVFTLRPVWPAGGKE